MAKKLIRDPKTRALRQEASLHPHPEQVTDELFSTQEFFDARDLVQVKYEMLRRRAVTLKARSRTIKPGSRSGCCNAYEEKHRLVLKSVFTDQPLQRFISGWKRREIPLCEPSHVLVVDLRKSFGAYPGGPFQMRSIKHHPYFKPFDAVAVECCSGKIGQQKNRAQWLLSHIRRNKNSDSFYFAS